MERKIPSSYIYWKIPLIPDQAKYELQSQHPRVRDSRNRVTDIQYATLVFSPDIQFLYFYLLSYSQEICPIRGFQAKRNIIWHNQSIIRITEH